ncbi:glycoside hydrolase family 88 protein [Paenibacillus sp.]|uniref:glycoside hydrolase family 88 protein n=1 Tax=Paenibacillus sp. TaxID=58172 RepID=UPI00281111D1|nr:glycoside hydrolase family 88 protein [Paenibacillus sp.]
MIEGLLGKTLRKMERSSRSIGAKSPHVAKEGIYDDARLDWWTSGFWPGMLWIAADLTGDAAYREAAWTYDERMERLFLEPNRFHHDVGFQFLPTAVLKHRLTGDEDGRRRGLFAANVLAGRYNAAGGFLRAWNDVADPSAWNRNNAGWAIIDSMMNLPLLFWASETSGDPRYRHIAAAHADTVLRRFVREDGSVAHISSFDPTTGDFLGWIGGQGFASDSAWSRGAAWALYGFAVAGRYTGEARYLEASRRVADFFLASVEADGVPLWDFRVVPRDGEPRDTSAASCAASGLLELAALLPPNEGEPYRDAARRTLRALADGYAAWDDPDDEALLRGGTGNKPAGQNVDVSLIYGDYFFLEALAKLSGWKHRVF